MPTIQIYIPENVYKELSDACSNNPLMVSPKTMIMRLAHRWAKLSDRTKGPRDWLAVTAGE